MLYFPKNLNTLACSLLSIYPLSWFYFLNLIPNESNMLRTLYPIFFFQLPPLDLSLTLLSYAV